MRKDYTSSTFCLVTSLRKLKFIGQMKAINIDSWQWQWTKKLQRWKIEINGKILKVVIRWDETSSMGNIISLREMFHRCDLKIELDTSHTTIIILLNIQNHSLLTDSSEIEILNFQRDFWAKQNKAIPSWWTGFPKRNQPINPKNLRFLRIPHLLQQFL